MINLRAKAPLRIETERLVLRQFTAADHVAYATMMADPEVTQFLGTGAPVSSDLAWRSVSGMLGHWQMLGYGIYAVERKDDGALVGQAGFIDVPGWPGFELAYMLGKAYWGNGYAREAAAAALRVARQNLQRDRVISLIRPANAASIRLALSLGALHEGAVDLLGSPAELFVYPR